MSTKRATARGQYSNPDFNENGIVYLNNVRHREIFVKNVMPEHSKKLISEIMFIPDGGRGIKWIDTDLIKLQP